MINRKKFFIALFLLCFAMLLSSCFTTFNFNDDIPANSVWEYSSEDLYIRVEFAEDGYYGTAQYRHIHYKNNQECDAWALFGVDQGGFRISELIDGKPWLEAEGKQLMGGDISYRQKNGYIIIERAITVNTPYCDCEYKDIKLELVDNRDVETDETPNH